MRGVDRIAAGDYDVRLAEQGCPETRDLSRSVMTMASRLRDAEAKRIALQADIAHELRSPLSVIQGTTEGMLDGVYPRDDAHLDLILRHSHMMARSLDDVRTIATAEAGALQLHLDRIDVREPLDEIAADFQDDADRKGVVLDRAGTSALNVQVDPTRLTEVVENLLKNALRHTSAGDRIELGAASTPKELVLWVRKTGEAFPLISFRAFSIATPNRSIQVGVGSDSRSPGDWWRRTVARSRQRARRPGHDIHSPAAPASASCESGRASLSWLKEALDRDPPGSNCGRAVDANMPRLAAATRRSPRAGPTGID